MEEQLPWLGSFSGDALPLIDRAIGEAYPQARAGEERGDNITEEAEAVTGRRSLLMYFLSGLHP